MYVFVCVSMIVRASVAVSVYAFMSVSVRSVSRVYRVIDTSFTLYWVGF